MDDVQLARFVVAQEVSIRFLEHVIGSVLPRSLLLRDIPAVSSADAICSPPVHKVTLGDSVEAIQKYFGLQCHTGSPIEMGGLAEESHMYRSTKQ